MEKRGKEGKRGRELGVGLGLGWEYMEMGGQGAVFIYAWASG